MGVDTDLFDAGYESFVVVGMFPCLAELFGPDAFVRRNVVDEQLKEVDAL